MDKIHSTFEKRTFSWVTFLNGKSPPVFDGAFLDDPISLLPSLGSALPLSFLESSLSQTLKNWK